MRLKIATLLWVAAVARAQETPPAPVDVKKLVERLDQLEKQNESMLSEIRELRAELAAAKPAERLDVQEARTDELAQSKVEASQRMPVAITGMLLFNAFTNGRYGGAFQDPILATLNAVQRPSGASFRQTVLGLTFHGPDLPGGGKSSGSFYMDFFAGSGLASNNLFHIRLATIDLAWKGTTLTVGQDKPIVAPREPTTLAQVGFAPLSSAGNLWNWQPQARIEQRFHFSEDSGVRAQAGVFETAEVYPGSSAQTFASTLERSRPAYQARVEYFRGKDNRRFEIAPGFSFSQSHVAGTSTASRIFTLDGLVRPASFVQFDGAFFHGRNATGLGALRQPFTVLATGVVLPVNVNGGWAQMSLFPTQRLSFHFYGGGEFDSGPGLPGGAISRNVAYAGNLIYKLAPNVLAALELSQNRTHYLSIGNRLNNHYDLAIAYLF